MSPYQLIDAVVNSLHATFTYYHNKYCRFWNKDIKKTHILTIDAQLPSAAPSVCSCSPGFLQSVTDLEQQDSQLCCELNMLRIITWQLGANGFIAVHLRGCIVIA